MVHLFVCLLLAKSNIFQVYWLVDFVNLSVCLSVFLLPTGHNFKPIFTKLHYMVEFVTSNKPIVFEVNIDQKVNTVPRSTTKVVFLKILNFHPIDLKFEEDLHIRSLNSTTN